MITSTVSKIQYNGNGSTTVFSFPYYFLENAHLVVTKTVISTGVDTVQVLTTNYTLTGAGNPAGGNVTMLVAPATGERLTIQRIAPQTQEVDYVNGDDFPAETHEMALDKLTMEVQQLQEAIARCIILSATDTSSSFILPPAAQRASKLLGFDSNGDLSLTSDAATEAAAAAASAAAASASEAAAAASAASASGSAVSAAASAASASAIAAGVLTTKGDLVTHNGSALVRLPVGANDTVPFADSAQSSGLAWKTIDLSTTRVTGTLPISKGGTNLTALGTALQQLRVNAGATALEYFTPSGTSGDIIVLEYRVASGTVGGSSANLSWVTRPINTEVADTGNLASIASNQITLAAGTYRIWVTTDGGRYLNAARLRLYNITNSTELVRGPNMAGEGNIDNASIGPATMFGRFTLAASKVLEIQQYSSVGQNNTLNLGSPQTVGEDEVYLTAILIKE